MEFKEFKRICYQICSETGFQIVDTYEARITPNFHASLIKMNLEKFYLICSIHGDWAFCKRYKPLNCDLEFINCKKMSDLLEDMFNIIPLTKEELDGPFSNRPYLLESDIKYWQPKKLGDGLFNWWD